MTYLIGQEKPSLEELLEHHGIKGMHWGIRKKDDSSGGQKSSAKPVSSEERAKREANAKKYEAIADRHQKRIDEIKAKPKGSYFVQKNRNDQIKLYEEARDTARKDAARKREGKLSDRQKKVATGAAVAVGLLAAYGAYKYLNTGQGNAMLMNGKAFLKGEGLSTWQKNAGLARKDLSPDDIFNKVARRVNPGYGGIGTKVNCRRCTMAYEMRRRGYDVVATRTTNSAGQTQQGMFNALRNAAESADLTKSHATFAVGPGGVAEATAFRTIIQKGSVLGEHLIEPHASDTHWGQSVFRALGNQPEGARGELGVIWSGGGGHSVAWEIIGGKPTIFDCQSGKRYTDPLTLFDKTEMSAAGYTRLDNKDLNHEYLKRWVKKAKQSTIT